MNTAKTLLSLATLNVKVISGPHAGEVFAFNKTLLQIGRGAENDIILLNDPKLSRSHVKVIFEHSKVQVENLSSRNPIFYNNKFESRVELKSKEKIRIGDTELQFEWDSEGFEPTIKATMTTELDKTEFSSLLNIASASLLKTNSPVVVPPASSSAAFSSSGLSAGALPAALTAPPSPSAPTGSPIPFPSGHAGAPASTPHIISPVASPTTPASQAFNPSALTTPQRSQAKSSPSHQMAAMLNQGRKSRGPKRKQDSSPLLLIGVGAVAILLLVWIFSSSDNKKPKKTTPLKDTNQINAELARPAQNLEQHMKEKHLLEDGRVDRLYESAQSYYVKGFRDYRQGQFSRAILSFQAALSFDPNHVLSRKYLHQSIKKHSELEQFNLDQAKRYKDKTNYRLCRSSAQQVLVMALRKDQSDPHYKEAKRLFDECDTLSKGRY